MKTYLSVLIMVLLGTAISGCAGETERQFVSGCESGGVGQSTCECIYDKLEDKYGEDALQENMYAMSSNGTFERDVVHSSMQCRDE